MDGILTGCYDFFKYRSCAFVKLYIFSYMYVYLSIQLYNIHDLILKLNGDVLPKENNSCFLLSVMCL